MKSLLLAIQFLTIIPVRIKGDLSEKELASSTVFFPIAGALQGLCVVSAAFFMRGYFGDSVLSGLILLTLLLTNGGFDMDGLMDTFDALAVKSSGDHSADIDKRLAVMKDSSVGAAGAMAMAMALLLKFLLVENLLRSVPFSAALSLIMLMPAFSKWVTVPAMHHSRSGRKDGLGRIFIEHTGFKQNGLASLALALICAFVLYSGASGYGMIFFLVSIFSALYLFCIIFVRFIENRFGGLTGDHFGAMSEIAEILFLMAVPLWLRHSTL